MNTATTYPIATLRDIYNLPTIDQMVLCLDELKAAMIQARIANDATVEALSAKNISVEKAFEWPEVTPWIDDNLGQIEARVGLPDGTELFRISSKYNPSPADH